MKEFIFQHWKDLIFLACLVLEVLFFIIGLFKKSKKEPSIFSYVLASLPELIKRAESVIGSGNGAKKLQDVLDSVSSIVKRETGQDLTSSERVMFSRFIEDILATPQKKGRT